MSEKTQNTTNPKDGDTEQGRASQDAEAEISQGRSGRTRSQRVTTSTISPGATATRPYAPGVVADERPSDEIFAEISRLVLRWDQAVRAFDRDLRKIRAEIGQDVETLRRRVRENQREGA